MLLAICLLCFTNINTTTVFAVSDISATSAIVIDTVTGRVIYEKNAYQKKSMASTTKIMTAIVAIDKGNLDDVVKTSRRASYVEGSSIWLEEGEKQRLEDLLYGLMLSSGNDAAIAIAEHIGGSVEEFAIMMTEKAREIGAVNTSFKNPHGLDADGHYTTAYDLALITRYALKNEKFAEIVKTQKWKIPWQGHSWDRVLNNKNKMLRMYEGCDGVKTGYTKKTGRCLVSSATRDDWQVVAVTINAPNDWSDHKKMLDYAFENYKLEVIMEKDEYMKTLPVIDGKEDTVSVVTKSGLVIPIKDGEKERIRIEYDIPDSLTAPISYNQEIGKIRFYLDDLECGEISLVSTNFVEKKDAKLAFIKIAKNWLMIFKNNR